jgi:MFS transporter, FHS family, L-fucose permease
MYRQVHLGLTIIFFFIGFITCLNNLLVPYFKSLFELSYFEASLVQLSFFGAYGLAAFPASRIVKLWGYKRSLILGLFLMALGCISFYPAAILNKYGYFLFSLLILGSGAVQLQVATNPLAAFLGPKVNATSRLTIIQSSNSLGTVLAPLLGAALLFNQLEKNLAAVSYPYLIIILILMMQGILLLTSNTPALKFHRNQHKVTERPTGLFKYFLGIFFYVGAEVTIATFFINYVMERSKINEAQASTMLALYWMGALAGRFIGYYTLKEFPKGKVLTTHALLAVSLILISINSFGLRAIYSMILVGVCNSIMFPTIFALGLKEVPRRHLPIMSGFLTFGISGGGILAVLTGMVADKFDLRLALLIPVFCYAYITWLGKKEATIPKI